MAATVSPGEPALLAFVSSVMSENLQPARDRVVETLGRAPFLLPWAFEYTPASSEDLDWSYLEKVRRSAFVFWLVGKQTTEPVEREVDEAIASQRRLIVMLLPDDDRDEATYRLLDRARSHAKYREPSSLDELGVEVDAAISDEITRALADRPGMGRVARLDELGRASRGRCVERWQAAGVSSRKALELADDPSVGAPPHHVWPAHDRPLTVLEADVGAGKSLAGERIHQAAIAAQFETATAPVAVWIKVSDSGDSLFEQVEAQSAGLGEPRQVGAAVVVDGADEAGPAVASDVLRESRQLVRTWPNTTVTITSRPLPVFSGIEEVAGLPPIGPNDARKLVGRFAGREIGPGAEHAWPQTLREAVRLPLFAVLLGTYLGRHGGSLPGTRAELLRDVVRGALFQTPEGGGALLRKLAVLSIERGGGPVPEAELGRPAAFVDLVRTRLVVRSGGSFRFPLIVFAQWFAAESLVDGDPDLRRLIGRPQALPRWLYPLAMVVGTYSHDDVTKLLSPLAEAHPGFTSQVIAEGLSRWSEPGSEGPWLPPEDVAGERIRACTDSWIASLRPLGQLTDRLDSNGSVRPLGVLVEGEWLTTGWYVGEGERANISRLPGDAFSFFTGENTAVEWIGIRGARPGKEAAWPWGWSHEDLKKALSEHLKARRLRLEEGPLSQARLWTTARQLLGLTFLHEDPIPIGSLVSSLPEEAEIAITQSGRRVDIRGFVSTLKRFQEQGRETLVPPFPGPDQVLAGGGFVWDPWSPERMLDRTTEILSVALDGYEWLCRGLFSGLCPWMETAVTLPAKLKGHLHSARPTEGWAGGPTLMWWLEALPEGEANAVELELDREAPDPVSGWVNDLVQRNRRLRPQQEEWLQVTVRSGFLEVFEPWSAEEFVFDWLWDDLKRIGWVEGMLGSRPTGYGYG